MKAAAGLLLIALLMATPASAQSPASRREPVPPRMTVMLFADAGVDILHAVDSLHAIFNRNSAGSIGGGLRVVLPKGLFANVRASRLQMTGERTFLFEGQSYSLGVADTLTIIPIQVSVAVRTGRLGERAVPYMGGGVGWYRASEQSAFSDASETAERTSPGIHLMGGADVRLWKGLGLGGEVEWSHVPGGLAGTGVATSLQDTNLGGVSVRMRLLVGGW
ncbi:MAG: hypothetical protein ABL971_13485 [Vicinamibacterales bacterium]